MNDWANFGIYSAMIHTTKYCIVLKRKALLTHAATQVQMKDSALNAVSQPQEYKSTHSSQSHTDGKRSKFQKLCAGVGQDGGGWGWQKWEWKQNSIFRRWKSPWDGHPTGASTQCDWSRHWTVIKMVGKACGTGMCRKGWKYGQSP